MNIQMFLAAIVALISHVGISHFGGFLSEETGFVDTCDSSVTAHNIHVTYASMVIDNKVASVRVRYFKHDLEKAVAAFAKRDSVVLGTDHSSDSLYVAYVDSTFRIEQNGRQLGARLAGSGEDGEMWWYQIEYEATRPISTLKVVNTQLTESFRDQKNILKAMNLASGVRKSFYYNRRMIEFDITL